MIDAIRQWLRGASPEDDSQPDDELWLGAEGFAFIERAQDDEPEPDDELGI